jgi:hypothetical protein
MQSTAEDYFGTKTPQQRVLDFWDSYIAKTPGSVTTIFPRSVHGPVAHEQRPSGGTTNRRSPDTSYEAAAAACRKAAARIRRDCLRSNTKYTDPEFDLKNNWRACTHGLMIPRPNRSPLPSAVNLGLSTLQAAGMIDDEFTFNISSLQKVLNPPEREPSFMMPEQFAVHRVDWIFEAPKFTVDGYSSSDVKQGLLGDCHWLSAVTTICHRQVLMDKVCVVKDEECGIYGFVFHRDGEWIYTVVDDNLFLVSPDYPEEKYDPYNDAKKTYKQNNQTGSNALLFAHCKDQNETWLPLLEKAYAKVHGDFAAIDGGSVGEAVEDMTGGVNSVIVTDNILSKSRLWEELRCGSEDFVFGLGMYSQSHPKNGIVPKHAHAILQAVEEAGEDGEKVRLVKIR